MILIDNRVGSKELMRYMDSDCTELCRMDYADAAFVGHGPDGPLTIGIERKTVPDLISSWITGRMAHHQLPGLTNTYNIIYLIVEGHWITGRDGRAILPFRKGKKMSLTMGLHSLHSREIHNYLNTLEVMVGIIVRQTRSLSDTAYLIKFLHYWWSRPYSTHTSHIDVRKGAAALDSHIGLSRPSMLCRVAAELPGIGPKRARDVATNFSSILDMALASRERWESIQGIGSKTIDGVMGAIQGEGVKP